MSVEYATRMEVLQRKREELTAQRQAMEKRMALREATAAEFSAVALQSCKQKWKSQRSAAVAAKKRNDEFVRVLHETQKQVHDTWSRLQSDQSSSSALLAQEKARYNRRVEQIYPAWQEQLQRQRVQKLRELEDKKRAVERRRYLAKKSFEKEQTLHDLIRKTRHEVEMAENLEQNELYERDLLRTQSTNQAKEVDQSIRDVALEARSYLQQQATKHLEVKPQLDEELADKLSETFSPRNALRALREGSSSFAFEENQQYEEEKPARQIRVEIPERMNTPTRAYCPEISQRGPNEGYSDDEYFEDDFVDEIPREFHERPVLFNSATAEGYHGNSYAGNNYRYTNIGQTINNRNHSAAVLHDQSSRAAAAKLAPVSPSQTTSYSEISTMEQQSTAPSSVHIPNATREDIAIQSRDKPQVLPTLVTGKLYPIPEANEPIRSDGTSSMVPNQTNRRNFETNNICEPENRNCGVPPSSTKPSSTIVGSTASVVEPSASTPSAKIEENRVASSPAASLTVATPVQNTRVGVGGPIDRQESAAAPEFSIKDAISQKPPVISIPAPNESSVVSPSIVEKAAESPAMVSVLGELRTKTEYEAAPPDINLSAVESAGLSLSVDSVSCPSKLDVASNTSIPDIEASEFPLETKENAAEGITSSKNIAGIEIEHRDSLKYDAIDVQDVEQTQRHDSDRKIDSFHDANSVRGMNISITDTSSWSVVEAAVEMPESVDEKMFADEAPESPPPSISYSMDLLEPFSPLASTPVHARLTEDDMMLSSMQSDDFDLSAISTKPAVETNPTTDNSTVINDVAPVVDSVAALLEPPSPAPEEINAPSITEKLSPVDRVKALGALISRVEEGATEGDTLGGSTDAESANESKRELLKMAVGGRKAQIAFFGSDISFELILDISRDLGPVLFPPKAFEGIMNDQKIRKLHQSNKEKQLDLWKTLSGYLKQLVHLKAIPAATLVDLFVTAFLAHDPDNQRSQRKLREFLVTVCGGGGSKTPSPQKELPPKREQRIPSPEPAKPAESDDRIRTPQLLQTAFLQRQRPPKAKVFGIASSSFKDRSSGSSDVLMSMSSGPMKLSQKLMRGGKMNDYSEFEEEEEVDLQNLIGTKPAIASGSSALGRSHQAAKTSTTGRSAAKPAAVEDEDDEFDADF